MRTRVSWLAEQLASGSMSACEVLNKCYDIDRARDVFERAELYSAIKDFRVSKIRDFKSRMKSLQEQRDWEQFQENPFPDTCWILYFSHDYPSGYELWIDYDLAEQERLAPSDREIYLGRLARELARKKMTYHDHKVWTLVSRFFKTYGLTLKEQVEFSNEYINECSRLQGV